MKAQSFILIFAFMLAAFAQADVDLFIPKPGPDNFGLVVRNKHHVIYRSAALGRVGLARLEQRLKKHKLPFPKTIIYMNKDGYKGGYFNSNIFALQEFEDRQKYGYDFYHSFRRDYPTFLDTYDPSHPRKNVNKKQYLSDLAIRYFGYDPDLIIDGGMEAFYRILDLVLETKGPVLFHCTGGHHRTGMITLAIRYLQGGDWVKGRFLGPLRRKYLNAAQYEYYKFNPMLFEASNVDFIEAWSKTPQFEEYYKRYNKSLNSEPL